MIVIDIETTGQVPWIHSILSIGAVDFSNPPNQFYRECRIKNGAKIDQMALRINGFSRKEIKSKDKKPLKDVLMEFLRWSSTIEDTTLAGHNHYMDVYFLECSFRQCKLKNPFKIRLVDTHTLTYVNYLSRGLMVPIDNRGSSISLGNVLNYCGLPDEPKPHNALTGAKMEAEALSRLIYGKNLLKEFGRFKVPEYLLKD